MGRYRVLWLLLGLVTSVALACQTATQAKVSLHTNLPYTQSTRVALWLGSGVPQAGTPPTITVDAPWSQDGALGDVVAVPPNNGAQRVAVYAVLARGVAPEQCLLVPSKECVVASRTFQYQTHEAVRVPVGLYRQCLGVSCAEGTTCNFQGTCVANAINTSTCSTEVGCLLEGDPPQPPQVTPDDALVPNDAGTQPPALASPKLSYRDENPAAGVTRGRLRLSPSPQAVDGYRVFWTDAQGKRLGLLQEWPAGAPSFELTMLDQSVPAGAVTLSAIAVQGLRESQASTARADNFPRENALELGVGGDNVRFPLPLLHTDNAGKSKLLVLGVNSSNRSTVRRCEADGSFCTRFDLGDQRGLGPAFPRSNGQIYQGFLYAVSVTKNGHQILHRCTVDMNQCTSTDIALGGFSEFGDPLAIAVDGPRNRVFTLTVEEPLQPSPKYDRALRRCSLDGTNCTRVVLPNAPAGDFGFAIDPNNGDVILGVSDYYRGGAFGMLRCAADGSTCTLHTAEQVEPTKERCFLRVAADAQGIYITAQQEGCDQMSPATGILAAACSFAGDTCITRTISPAQNEYDPSVTLDSARNHVLITVASDASAGSTAIYLCGRDLMGCHKEFLPTTFFTHAPYATVDQVTGQIYVTAQGTSRGPAFLARCNEAAQNCALADLSDTSSKLSVSDNGFSPSLSVGSNGALLLGSLVRNADTSEAAVHSCATGTSCQRLLRTSAQEIDVAAWPAKQSLVIAARAEPSNNVSSLSLGVCAASASSCAIDDASFGRPQTGYGARVLPDVAGNKLAIVHQSGSRAVLEPLLTSCANDGTGCTVRELLTEASLPLKSHFGWDAKRGEGDDLYVSSVADGRVRLLRCNATQSGCSAQDLGPAPAVDVDLFAGTSVMPSAQGVDVLVGSATGIERHQCPASQACVPMGSVLSFARGGAPQWLTTVRVPEDNTVYIATFAQSELVQNWLLRDEILATLRVYRCDAAFSRCTTVFERRDARTCTINYEYSRPDGGHVFNGGPPALVYDAARRRILVAATDAGNLYRPMVLDFDTY